MDLKFLAARRVAPTVFACVLAAAMFLPAGHVLARDGGDSYADRDDWQDRDRDEDARDPVVLSFSTVGDSRQDPVAPDLTTLPLSVQDKMWLQNTKAWSRIMRSIQSQAPELMFFNGDMIMGYGKASVPTDTSTVAKVVGSDLVQFYTQYAFWRGMVTQLLETGTYVVPVPGNHEVQSKAAGKKAQVENENAWRANMGDLILDPTRFQTLFNEKPTNVNVGNNASIDLLASDQTQLSYSFDFHGSHFVVVNTDPVGKDSHAPTQWLASDLASASSRGLTHFFVFGHKPAYTYYYGANPASPLPAAPAGLDIDVPARDAFWGVIEQYGATYFAGHEHIFHIGRPLGKAGSAVQVLVGSGGSPFDAAPTVATLAATDRFYAWATVKVRRSGRVQITAYGFNDQYGPTHMLDNLVLPH
jgi:hypothetical protein